MTRPVLDRALALRLLEAQGIASDPESVTVRALPGGVSSIVLLVETPTSRLVLKQPRERFQVEDEWLVPTARVRVEHEAARFLDRHLPPWSVAPPVFFDPDREVVAFEAMPTGWRSWKDRLLGGTVEPPLAHEVGRLLGRLHRLVAHLDDPDHLRQDDLFIAQRLDPYFRATARRLPEAAPALASVERAFFARADLVHGDFTPKNLLTDGARPVLVDHEVMTRGDAAYDLGSVRAHLFLKAIHMPARRAALLAAAGEVDRGYGSAQEPDPGLAARAHTWTGAILLARVHGKSRAEYLGREGRAAASELGLGILHGRVSPGDIAAALT